MELLGIVAHLNQKIKKCSDRPEILPKNNFIDEGKDICYNLSCRFKMSRMSRFSRSKAFGTSEAAEVVANLIVAVSEEKNFVERYNEEETRVKKINFINRASQPAYLVAMGNFGICSNWFSR